MILGTVLGVIQCCRDLFRIKSWVFYQPNQTTTTADILVEYSALGTVLKFIHGCRDLFRIKSWVCRLPNRTTQLQICLWDTAMCVRYFFLKNSANSYQNLALPNGNYMARCFFSVSKYFLDCDKNHRAIFWYTSIVFWYTAGWEKIPKYKNNCLDASLRGKD